MIFVWVEEDNKDSQIFATWVHTKFIERDNDVQSNQILAFLYTNESLVYQWQRVVISFDQSIELSVIDAETQTIIFFFRRTRWARRIMRSWRKWILCLDDWSDTSLSSEACDRTSDIVCFEKAFLHQSTQFCDRRNDAMIADRSLLDRRRLDSRDIQREAWSWLARELQRGKAHADSLLQACFQL